MRNACLILPLLLLTACFATTVPIDNQIAASRATLTVAQKGAYGYVDQPLCGTAAAVGKTICSKPSVIAKIKMADNAAMTAQAAAEEAKDETSLAVTQTAYKALLEITNSILAGR